MKFIMLMITTQLFTSGAKYKNEDAVLRSFERTYVKVEEIQAIERDRILQLYSRYDKEYYSHPTCEIKRGNAYVLVDQPCEDLVKEINGLK